LFCGVLGEACMDPAVTTRTKRKVSGKLLQELQAEELERLFLTLKLFTACLHLQS
ncbi:hypothetical protein P7K49_032582, partial [Saguinus oedipus]